MISIVFEELIHIQISLSLVFRVLAQLFNAETSIYFVVNMNINCNISLLRPWSHFDYHVIMKDKKVPSIINLLLHNFRGLSKSNGGKSIHEFVHSSEHYTGMLDI